ncbi:MAG: phosphoribosylanthranilate isomerase [Terriglobales bacterium]
MWIKICGTTNLEDARLAVDAGADALGFVFAPSPRRINPRDAGRIIRELGNTAEKVGVFVNQSPEIILDTVEKAGLTAVQLHGDEELAVARQLLRAAQAGKRTLKIIKTVSMADRISEPYTGAIDESWDREAHEVISALLLDSGSRGKRGGSGEVFDWQTSAPIVRFLGKRFKVIIAGGLNAQNVGNAIELFRPWGVDVASGIEREPGKKDAEKVRAFIKAVREAS